MSLLSISNIDIAHLTLKPFITQTPLVTNEAFNSLVNAKVYFKLENLQKTASSRPKFRIIVILQGSIFFKLNS